MYKNYTSNSKIFQIYFNKCWARTIQLIQAQIVLNPTRVGRSFLFDAQIRDKLVARVRKYNHQIWIPQMSPGIMITALANQLKNSTLL